MFRPCMALVETEADCFVRGYHRLQRNLDYFYRRDLEKEHRAFTFDSTNVAAWVRGPTANSAEIQTPKAACTENS